MRIITGKLRGMNLFSPKDMQVRPTADRVKESVFNILGNSFDEGIVLDLFSGSGNLGIEAWSRGAGRIFFVDSSSKSLNVLNKNIEKAKIQEFSKICKRDALKVIPIFFEQKVVFDFIFCDPPYNNGYVNKIIAQLEEYDILRDKGTIIIEHNHKENVDLVLLNKLSLARDEKYGDTVISFLKKSIGRD